MASPAASRVVWRVMGREGSGEGPVRRVAPEVPGVDVRGCAWLTGPRGTLISRDFFRDLGVR
jgi:hypothetical protein